METITLGNDITVFYITAKSFPDGIMDAHQALHALVPFSIDRKYFGISRPENGVIVYKAAAEEISHGEAEKFNCPRHVIKKGKYIYLTIIDYKKDVQSIRKAFDELLSHPGLDPHGYCVEWYLPTAQAGPPTGQAVLNDVKCMVRLKE